MLKPKTKPAPLRILIVEDNNFLRHLFCQSFYHSHLLYPAATAERGWRLYLEQTPHIVFLDIKLPGINGHMLASQIKQHTPQAFVVMVTASDKREDMEEAMHNHVDGFIVKPFSKRKINDYIERYKATYPRE
jgi:YesN/AraC family two-component response regulator